MTLYLSRSSLSLSLLVSFTNLLPLFLSSSFLSYTHTNTVSLFHSIAVLNFLSWICSRGGYNNPKGFCLHDTGSGYNVLDGWCVRQGRKTWKGEVGRKRRRKLGKGTEQPSDLTSPLWRGRKDPPYSIRGIHTYFSTLTQDLAHAHRHSHVFAPTYTSMYCIYMNVYTIHTEAHRLQFITLKLH